MIPYTQLFGNPDFVHQPAFFPKRAKKFPAGPEAFSGRILIAKNSRAAAEAARGPAIIYFCRPGMEKTFRNFSARTSYSLCERI